ATQNLGFWVTCAVSYEHSYTLTRRFSTLDHLTGGRIGWNVVIRISEQHRQGNGTCPTTGARHALRNCRRLYAGRLEAVGRQLGEWGGAARPRATRVRATGKGASHPARRPVFRDGSDPPLRTSPQRTPLIYQAGASSVDANSLRLMPNACLSTGLRSK